MEILDHIRRVHTLIQEDVSAALTLFGSTSLVDFLTEEAVTDALFQPLLADMFSLAEDEMPHMAKSVRKEKRKMDRLRTMTAHIYAGVPHKIAAWGHEAHAEGLRAFGMERSAKASPQMKGRAHHEAQQAHMKAAHMLSTAGHKDAAMLHQRAAEFHRGRQNNLGRQHGVHAESRSDRLREMMRLSRVRREAKGQDDPMPGPAKAPKKKPDYSMGFPKEEQIHNWISDLDEADYPDEVKRASKLAGNATAVTKEKHANADHHEHAARLHFIAKGVALAHGHKDLAAKHAEFVNKHRDAAKQSRAAS